MVINKVFYSKSMNLWVEKLKIDGKPKTITGKTQKILKQKLKDLDMKRNHKLTFTEAAEEWEESHAKKVEETTAGSYSPHVRRACAFFEGRAIIDITPDEVQSYVEYLANDLGMAKDTVRRGLVVVNKIFKFAITSPGSELRYNPCSAVEIPRGLKQTQRDPPEPEQLKKLAAADPEDPITLFAHFLWYTGLRPSELFALRWEDINREKKQISITKAATYPTSEAVVKDRTKTKAGTRTVPLLDQLDAMLPKSGKGYVFGGEKPYDKQRFYRAWTKWCAGIGLAEEIVEEHTGPNGHKYRKTTYRPLITPYQFRHEYASMLEDEGVSEFDAQHVMGHSSIVVTKDKYTKYRLKKNHNSVADRLNKRFSSES